MEISKTALLIVIGLLFVAVFFNLYTTKEACSDYNDLAEFSREVSGYTCQAVYEKPFSGALMINGVRVLDCSGHYIYLYGGK